MFIVLVVPYTHRQVLLNDVGVFLHRTKYGAVLAVNCTTVLTQHGIPFYHNQLLVKSKFSFVLISHGRWEVTTSRFIVAPLLRPCYFRLNALVVFLQLGSLLCKQHVTKIKTPNRAYQQMDFENQSVFGEDMNRSSASFLTRGVGIAC